MSTNNGIENGSVNGTNGAHHTNGDASPPEDIRDARVVFTRDVKATSKVYSTGAIAKMCRVAPRTVSKWFDSGKLKGYRIPGSNDRRVPAEALQQFLQDYHLPMGEPDEKMVVGLFLPRPVPELETSQFRAGFMAATGSLGAVILGCAEGLDTTIRLAEVIRSESPHSHIAIWLGEDRSVAPPGFKWDKAFSWSATLTDMMDWAAGLDSPVGRHRLRPRNTDET